MFRQLPKRFFAILFLVITVSIASLSILSASPAGGTETTLRAQLEALAASSGVVISGLDHISDGAAHRSVKGTLEIRLKSLLEDYNYMVVKPSSEQIEKVIITSLKQPPDKRYISPYVASTRVGAHHQVQAFIIGPNNQGRDVALLVDTGASTIVLPASMSTQLGFHPGDLKDGVTKTASDRVAVKLGVLKSVRLGQISVNDVKVTFISDDRLGNTMLLGMSFLERFNVTIDDARNALILLRK
ncbi:MAG: retropepsin-like aspartic protease family protein [Gammaproteobacteria bacterium]